MTRCLYLIILAAILTPSYSQNVYYGEVDYKCPQYWLKFQDSCYRFIKSPARPREDARKNCQAYQSDLVTINSLEEHGFILHQLQWQDHQHRKWYTGVKSIGGYWTNEGDGVQLANMENAFLPEANDGVYNKDYLIYSYSEGLKRWGLEKVTGLDNYLYICEAPITVLHNLVEDERTYEYGLEINDPLKVPRGPYFVKQPVNTVFDTMKASINNDVSLSCIAGGYPAPTYEWFKENYDNDRFYATKIDPLSDSRFTISGGMLIIHNPQQDKDRGSYHCRATNKFGTIRSESVELTFGYIREFNLKRSAERGDQHWGKAVYCDPPQYFPSISYYWVRETFENMVQEDMRVFVSFDGALYFASLELIDQGNYSCHVKGISDNGRIGPLFPIYVDQQSSSQELKFANNFPKAFPEAPKAGDQVRLECLVFGYPVAAYNWTRKNNAPLPRGAELRSYNRVLIIPNVEVEDQGVYECLAYNDRSSVKNSVYLSIQAEPNFTIPLTDKHMDHNSELIWTCEAFGIPEVSYTWLKNGEPMYEWDLPGEDVDRYVIQDNVFKIKQLDPKRDSGMYQCSAKNQLTTKYSSAQLRVLSLKPSFKKRPMESETYAAENGNVTIICNPEAAPRPKFTWKKDRNVIGSGGRRLIMENGNLIIRPVSRDDEGTYVCTASNIYGSDESRGRLIVLRGPRFVEKLPTRIRTAVNYNQTLRCRADVEETVDIAYIWKHNGREIREKDMINNPHIIFDEGVLDIINITFAEAGDYECIIKSAIGRISTKTELIVEGPPGPPGGVQVVDTQRRSATIRWTDGAFNGRPIMRYKISARTGYNSTWYDVISGVEAVEIDRYTGRKEFFIENLLNPYTAYEFRVSAYNELGYGQPSNPSPQHSTSSDKPAIAPRKVGGGGGKVGDLTITWEPLKPAEQFGPGIFYKVFWRKKGGDTQFQSKTLKEHGNINKCVVHVKKVNYYTKYEVKVQAANDLGSGPESEIVTIYSAEDMPQVAPQLVEAISYNSTALNVSWSPVDESRERMRGKLTGHRIKYWRSQNPEESAVYYLSRHTRPWSLVVGLQPDTYYYVKVMAYNNAGEGPESERFLERTYRKAPQKPPSSVAVNAVNPSTVRVVWRYVQPSIEEEPLLGFKIRVWEVDQDMSRANDTIVPIGQELEAYISNLSPGKAYHLRVLGYSHGGDGRMSSPAHTFQMGDTAQFSRNRANKTTLDAVLSLFVLFILGAFQRT